MTDNAIRENMSLYVVRLCSQSTYGDPELDVIMKSFNPADTSASTGFSIPVDKLPNMPQNLENIFLGETSCWYICIRNEHKEQALPSFSLKVDVQTSSQRFSLPSAWTETSPVQDLQPGQTLGQVLTLEVKELGQHIIVCTVNQATNADPKQYFRKYTKFFANKPLDVRTKFHNGNVESDDVFLEAQIQNTTQAPMFMERVVLEPSDFYFSTPINTSDRTLDLFLVLEKSVLSGLLWSARSNRSLGKVEAGGSVSITLSLLPITAGLQTISGIRLTDTYLKRTYEHDEIAQVFVYS